MCDEITAKSWKKRTVCWFQKVNLRREFEFRVEKIGTIWVGKVLFWNKNIEQPRWEKKIQRLWKSLAPEKCWSPSQIKQARNQCFPVRNRKQRKIYQPELLLSKIFSEIQRIITNSWFLGKNMVEYLRSNWLLIATKLMAATSGRVVLKKTLKMVRRNDEMNKYFTRKSRYRHFT